MTIKLLSPCPDDAGNTSMGNVAPTENSAAYKKYVAPKEPDYQYQDLSDADIEKVIANLDSMELREQIKFVITLNKSQRKSQSQILDSLGRLEKGQNTLMDKLVKTEVYLLMHKKRHCLKIGYSENIDGRLKHHRKEWIILAHEHGSKQRESRMKQVLKESGFIPMPCTEEVFEITPALVDILEANGWVGANEHRDRLLKKDVQLDLTSQNV